MDSQVVILFQLTSRLNFPIDSGADDGQKQYIIIFELKISSLW
jgi:hypothetical protein